jgi:hypothetical protein
MIWFLHNMYINGAWLSHGRRRRRVCMCVCAEINNGTICHTGRINQNGPYFLILHTARTMPLIIAHDQYSRSRKFQPRMHSSNSAHKSLSARPGCSIIMLLLFYLWEWVSVCELQRINFYFLCGVVCTGSWVCGVLWAAKFSHTTYNL